MDKAMQNGNESAHPVIPERGNIVYYGITKREHFAAMAMQGLCASPNKGDFNRLGPLAVAIADNVLRALSSSNGGEA